MDWLLRYCRLSLVAAMWHTPHVVQHGRNVLTLAWMYCIAPLQVMSLLTKLFGVDSTVIQSEVVTASGRCDLVLFDRHGLALLTIEFKLQHSGAAQSSRQDGINQVP